MPVEQYFYNYMYLLFKKFVCDIDLMAYLPTTKVVFVIGEWSMQAGMVI